MAEDDARRAHPRGWVKLYKYLPSNPKIKLLTDGAFRAYVTALALSEDEQVRGRWKTREYLAAALGKRLARHIDRLLELELLVEYDDDMIGIHAFDYWNPIDEGSRVRQRRWYANNQREAVGLPRVYANGRETVPNVANALGTHRQDETRRDQTDTQDGGPVAAASGAATEPSFRELVPWRR